MNTSNWLRSVGRETANQLSLRSAKRRRIDRRGQAPAGSVVEAVEPRVLLSSYVLSQNLGFSNYSESESGITLDSAGNAYGTTQSGGATGDGSIFEVPKGSSTIVTIASFNSMETGSSPEYGKLAIDSSGDLFGTAYNGGADSAGTLFEVAAGSSSITVLANFQSSSGNSTGTGTNPAATVALDSSGDIFGTTTEGGPDFGGTVWEFANGASTISVLAGFNTSTGEDPIGGVTMDANGNLFGTTSNEGANFDGTVWELANGASTVTVVGSFDSTTGSEPDSGVTIDAAGNLFGTTQDSGANYSGTVWEIANGSSTISVVASFNGSNGQGPTSGVILDPEGNLLGTSQEGGAHYDGAVYEVIKGSGTITDLYSFNYSDGDQPKGDLALDSSGDLFGTTNSGGPTSGGTVFELTVIPTASEVSLMSSQSPADFGAPVTFTATVTGVGAAAPAAGSVYFYDVTAGDTLLGTATAPSSPGADTWTYTTTLGQLNITSGDVIQAAYAPGTDFNYVGNTAQVTQIVTGAPTLASVTPSSVTAGAGDTSVVLIGSGFAADSVAQFNGSAIATTYINGGALTAVIPAGDLTSAGSDSITVSTPAPGGTSLSQQFTVNAGATTVTPKSKSVIYAADDGGYYNGKPFPASGYVTNGPNGPHIGTPTFIYYLASDTHDANPLAGVPSAPGNYTYRASFAGTAMYPATTTTGKFSIHIPVTSFAAAAVKFSAGTAFNGTVATFSAPAALPLTDFVATIDWGDGQSSTATIAAGAKPGQFVIKGKHTYAKNITYKTAITLTPAGTSPLMAKGSAA